MVKYSFNLLCLELGSYLINEGKFSITGNPFEATKFYSLESDYAKEIILAADNSSESYAMQKKNDLEKQADAAR